MDIEYGLRGVQRSEFEVDNYQLQNFHALESDWHEISHWVMSIEDNLSSINNKKNTMKESQPYGTIMSLQFCWIFAIKI